MKKVLVLVIAAVLAAASAVGAGGQKGGPSTVLNGGRGVVAPNGKVRYVALTTGQSTIVSFVRIRGGQVIWEKPFLSGEDNMSHTIANLEYHHFKYRLFREPGDVHIHMFGTATLSFADGIKTEAEDIFEIEEKQFGAPLRNVVAWDADRPVRMTQL